MRFNKSFKKFLTSIFVIAITITGVFAENSDTDPYRFNGWQVIGPTGGDIRAIAIDPRDKNRLYITTLDSQVYTSPDAGKTWKFLVAFNRPQLTLDDIIVDAEDSNRVYVSGHRHKQPGGFYYTTDAGQTWNEAKDLKNEAIHGMTQSKKNPNMLVVGSAGKVFVSYNRGEDWKKLTDEKIAFYELLVDSLAVDPKDTNIIYVGTTWRAYKSIDAGKTWKLISKGMIDDSDVFAIDIDPENSNHIIASACSGIYESMNGGELWAKVQGIPSQSRRTKAIVRNPTKNGAVYAGTTEGFWMSADNGKTWALTSQRELEVNSIAVHPTEPNKVYIATNNYGIMVSNDGGRNFAIYNGNFTSRFMHEIIPDIERPNRFYATSNNTATGGGFLFISDDGGTTWKPSTKNLSVIRIVPNTLYQDRTTPNTLYLGTNVGIYRSIDRGINWEQLKAPKVATTKKKAPAKKTTAKKGTTPAVVTPPAFTKVAAITDKINVMTELNDGKNGILAATDKGLYRTYNIATGWEKYNLGAGVNEQIFAIHTSPSQPQTIWVGTARSGLIVSKDSGLTWKKVSDIPSDMPISAIVTNPQSPNWVYVGNIQTLYLSRDGGQSWTRRGGGLPAGNYNSILINPNNPNEVIVGSSMEGRGGIYQSLDGGNLWKQVDTKDLNLPSRRVWAMTFDPKNTNRILVATHSSGIFRIERESAVSGSETNTRPRVAANPNE